MHDGLNRQVGDRWLYTSLAMHCGIHWMEYVVETDVHSGFGHQYKMFYIHYIVAMEWVEGDLGHSLR